MREVSFSENVLVGQFSYYIEAYATSVHNLINGLLRQNSFTFGIDLKFVSWKYCHFAYWYCWGGWIDVQGSSERKRQNSNYAALPYIEGRRQAEVLDDHWMNQNYVRGYLELTNRSDRKIGAQLSFGSVLCYPGLPSSQPSSGHSGERSYDGCHKNRIIKPVLLVIAGIPTIVGGIWLCSFTAGTRGKRACLPGALLICLGWISGAHWIVWLCITLTRHNPFPFLSSSHVGGGPF